MSDIMHQPGDYIRIMSDGSECFIEDTECFLSLYPDERGVYVRPTLEQFVDLINRGMGDFLGEHIIGEHEGRVMNTEAGNRIWDLEWCELKEFYFEYENEPMRLNRKGEKVS